MSGSEARGPQTLDLGSFGVFRMVDPGGGARGIMQRWDGSRWLQVTGPDLCPTCGRPT